MPNKTGRKNAIHFLGADKPIRNSVKKVMRKNRVTVAELSHSTRVNRQTIQRFLDGGGLSTRSLSPILDELGLEVTEKAAK
jgi:hypothetical protein